MKIENNLTKEEVETRVIVNELKSARSPTLDTVMMVEKVIDEYSGEFTKRQLWEKLPRKVLWGTYLRIIEYLVEINKIILDDKGILVYIWDPVGAALYMKKEKVKHGR